MLNDTSAGTLHAEATLPAAGSIRRYRILVVDDLPAIHRDIAKVLTAPVRSDPLCNFDRELCAPARARIRDVEFKIDSAFHSTEAIQLVQQATEAQQPYALAIVDMRMPQGKDGLETVVSIWEIDPRIQIVICSAYSDHSWHDIVTRTGETDQLVILRKPFESIELKQLAHALARKWDLHRAAQLHLETLEGLVRDRTYELREKQAIFQLTLENVTDLIAVVDAGGRRIYNSPSYKAVLGFDPDELRETHAFAHVHPDDLAKVQRAVDDAVATGRGELTIYRARHQDGSWRTLEACAGIVQGPDGKLAYLVIVARDVTARHEQELKRDIGRKLESIGRLAAGVAHEINTPIQYITDNTRFLTDGFRQCENMLKRYRGWRVSVERQGDVGGEARSLADAEAAAELDYLLSEIPRALQQNLDGLARITRIVQSLKEFSHPNTPNKEPADLNRAILTAIAVCRHEWKYVAEIATELDPALPPVPCILDEFNQVMLNLLVNAAHTIGESLKMRGEKLGIITVRTRTEENTAVVEVSDTGMGIPPELHDRIFEPFFTTKEVGHGTGQGLSIVHAVVVKHHQGAVDFTSEPGHGATFRLKLPLITTLPAAASPGPLP